MRQSSEQRPLDELDRASIIRKRDELLFAASPDGLGLCRYYADKLTAHLAQPYLSAFVLGPYLAGINDEIARWAGPRFINTQQKEAA